MQAGTEIRAARATQTDGPVRRCIVTGERRPRAEMVRFVIGPDDAIVPDIAGDLPGRGLWLTPRRDIVEAACAKRLFARAARRRVKVADDLPDRVEDLLVRRCLRYLGLARRAGEAGVGFETGREWARRGRVAALLTASDGAEAGAQKMRAAVARAGVPVIRLFTASELGGAVGRTMAVHVVLAPGGLAARFVAEARRLAGFRGDGEYGRHMTVARAKEKADVNE